MSEKILVTGGAGFLGSHVVELLLKKGIDVTVVFDRTYGGKISHIKDQVKWIRGDIRDFNQCQKAVKGVDTIIHLAALINIDHSIRLPLDFYEVNVRGTSNLLEAVRREPSVKKFVYMSTCEVYGNIPRGKASELAHCYPRSPYASSKYAAERYCLSYHYTYKKPEIAIVRGFNIFGTRQSYGVRGAVIPIFITKVLNNAQPIIFGTGNQSRDYVYVTDVASGVVKAALKRGIGGEIFNLASGKPVTIKAIANKVIKLTGANLTPIYGKPRAGEMLRSCGDNSKARRTLKWNLEVPFVEGLKRTIAYLKEQSD